MADAPDVFVRFRIGRSYTSDVWAVLLRDEPVDLSVNGWVTRVEADVAGQVRTWTTDTAAPGRVVLGYADVDLGGPEAVRTSTVRITQRPEFTDEWAAFAGEFEVVIERELAGADAERHTVLSGFMRGDDRVSDDSPAGIW